MSRELKNMKRKLIEMMKPNEQEKVAMYLRAMIYGEWESDNLTKEDIEEIEQRIFKH